MAMLLGKKIGMTRVYDEDGNLVPATVVHAGPCVVTQVKTVKTDGYNAVQIGYQDKKPSRQTKPLVGHCAKAGTSPKQFVREMRLGQKDTPEYQPGDSLTVSVFADTQSVDVVATSKGKGFAGGMKRHGFGGFPASHGTERKHRAPGSQSSHGSNSGGNGGPKKGKRMSGHMGDVQVTTKNHRVLAVDSERNLLIVKGAISGASGNYCVIKSAK
jgi:large subunit ribosomal protein L3